MRWCVGGKAGQEGTTPKRARHAYRSGGAGASASGAATSEGASDGAGKDREKSKDDDKALSLVEKRLKQNREAARRSRERKRHLKEELRRRMPVLQKQHDEMAAEVDELMKSMWVRCSVLCLRCDRGPLRPRALGSPVEPVVLGSCAAVCPRHTRRYAEVLSHCVFCIQHEHDGGEGVCASVFCHCASGMAFLAGSGCCSVVGVREGRPTEVCRVLRAGVECTWKLAHRGVFWGVRACCACLATGLVWLQWVHATMLIFSQAADWRLDIAWLSW